MTTEPWNEKDGLRIDPKTGYVSLINSPFEWGCVSSLDGGKRTNNAQLSPKALATIDELIRRWEARRLSEQYFEREIYGRKMRARAGIVWLEKDYAPGQFFEVINEDGSFDNDCEWSVPVARMAIEMYDESTGKSRAANPPAIPDSSKQKPHPLDDMVKLPKTLTPMRDESYTPIAPIETRISIDEPKPGPRLPTRTRAPHGYAWDLFGGRVGIRHVEDPIAALLLDRDIELCRAMVAAHDELNGKEVVEFATCCRVTPDGYVVNVPAELSGKMLKVRLEVIK